MNQNVLYIIETKLVGYLHYRGRRFLKVAFLVYENLWLHSLLLQSRLIWLAQILEVLFLNPHHCQSPQVLRVILSSVTHDGEKRTRDSIYYRTSHPDLLLLVTLFALRRRVGKWPRSFCFALFRGRCGGERTSHRHTLLTAHCCVFCPPECWLILTHAQVCLCTFPPRVDGGISRTGAHRLACPYTMESAD